MTDGPTERDSTLPSGNLDLAHDGIWYARGHQDLRYLEQDDTDWLLIEEKSFWYQHRSKLFVEIAKRYPPSGEIFEVGAGHGAVSIALQNAGFRVIAVEPTINWARYARGTGIKEVVCATLENSGFGVGALSNVGMFDVLEHIPNDVEYLRYVRSLMKSGGRFYCAVPAHNLLWSNEDEYAGHHRRYALGDLCHKIDSAGFEIEYGTYYFRPLVLPILLLRSLPTALGLRSTRTPGASQREHCLQPGMVSRGITRLLAGELKAIATGGRIRFGASCVVVARAN